MILLGGIKLKFSVAQEKPGEFNGTVDRHARTTERSLAYFTRSKLFSKTFGQQWTKFHSKIRCELSGRANYRMKIRGEVPPRTKILSETRARFKPEKTSLKSETERDDNQPDRSDKN